MNEKRTTIKGFFVVFADETQELNRTKVVNEGRSGVFYKKEDLVTTIDSKMLLESKKQEMSIVEIDVPNCAIISPNHNKFGIKGGQNIPITKIQKFSKAMIAQQTEVA